MESRGFYFFSLMFLVSCVQVPAHTLKPTSYWLAKLIGLQRVHQERNATVLIYMYSTLVSVLVNT